MKTSKELRVVLVLAFAVVAWSLLFWSVVRDQMQAVLTMQSTADTLATSRPLEKNSVSVISPYTTKLDTASGATIIAPTPGDKLPQNGDPANLASPLAEITHGPTDQKWVALTFDAELDPTAARQNLLILRQKDVRATLFVMGDWTKRYPEIISIAANDGHEFGNHSYSHINFTTLNDGWVHSEIVGAEKAVQDLTGKTTKPFFRFPFGDRLDEQVKLVNQEGYTVVKWSVDPYDWRDPAEDVLARTTTDIPNGAIIVLHLGSPATAQVLGQIIDELRGQGYELVTVGEMIEEMEG